MKRILFNATQSEELRMALVDGQKLLDLDIEATAQRPKKSNIYKAAVTRVEPSLEAVFVEYGSAKQGFLPLKEISRKFFREQPDKPLAEVRVQEVIGEGDEMLVQVEKDERGTKGAALTTFISLAGRYLVLKPDNPHGGGISRRIEGEERADLRGALSSLEAPREHALIVRTQGIGKSAEELQGDTDYLLQLWKTISEAAAARPAPFLVYQESNLLVRAIRDHLRDDIAEVLVDEPQMFERAERFMKQVMPGSLRKLKLHDAQVPLFSRFQIEHQIEAAFSRNIRLPSGGALVIDHTEAVVTIDVNSARATKAGGIEETALQTNIEAAEEIARQLRIRDIGGLIVIDFIDMMNQRNQRQVENRLGEALRADRARVQTERISKFGLLEMSRQRLRSALSETNYAPCPRCHGNGMIRTVASSSLNILRLLEEEAMKENTRAVHAHLPVETATLLLNEKRGELSAIENRLSTRIVIVPNPDMETPDFQLQRLANGGEAATDVPSYQLKAESETAADAGRRFEPRRAASPAPAADAKAAVNLQDVEAAMATVKRPRKPGLLVRALRKLFGRAEKPKPAAAPRRRGRPGAGRGGGNAGRGRGRRSEQPRRDGAGAGSGGRRTTGRTTQAQGERKPRATGGATGDSNPQRGRRPQRRNASAATPARGGRRDGNSGNSGNSNAPAASKNNREDSGAQQARYAAQNPTAAPPPAAEPAPPPSPSPSPPAAKKEPATDIKYVDGVYFIPPGGDKSGG